MFPPLYSGWEKEEQNLKALLSKLKRIKLYKGEIIEERVLFGPREDTLMQRSKKK